MRQLTALPLVVSALLLVTSAAAEQKDNPKCKDHQWFSKMPGTWIYNCNEKEFASHAFPIAKGKTMSVEGKLFEIKYYPQAELKTKPSDLQIMRNLENAAQKLGASAVWTDKSRATWKLMKDGREYWIEFWAEFTGKYGIYILEKGEMAQDIVANAETFSNDIRNTGHASVYGILFDTGKAEIKPESAAAIGEIAKLLKKDVNLKLHVVGHTDNVGGIDGNLKLSQARADAVMQELTRDHGVAAARLRSFGCGQFAPVASNDSEDGRAKNRRVELVKQ